MAVSSCRSALLRYSTTFASPFMAYSQFPENSGADRATSAPLLDQFQSLKQVATNRNRRGPPRSFSQTPRISGFRVAQAAVAGRRSGAEGLVHDLANGAGAA